MKKTVLIFGLISGVIMAALMFGTLPFTDSAWLQSHSMFIGYTTMVLSFMLVFFVSAPIARTLAVGPSRSGAPLPSAF